MAIGSPLARLVDRPRRGERRNTVQLPDLLLERELRTRTRRAGEIAVVPKRSATYFGAIRPARAPRLMPLGRANEPTEKLRQTLVARTRYFQDQARAQGPGQGGGFTQ